MKIMLAVRQQGHVPSFKNNKMLAKGKLITDPAKQKWMERCIQSFESQLFCGSAITGGEMPTAPCPLSLTASLMPLDDSRQWIPELHVYCEEVKPGEEGAVIIIEKL